MLTFWMMNVIVMTLPQNKLVAAIYLDGRVLTELSQHQLDFMITFNGNCLILVA